jgi:DNA recombination protein RmuC
MTEELIIALIVSAGLLFLAIIYRWLGQLKELLQESRERSNEVIEEKLKREEQYIESRKADIKTLVEQVSQQLKESQQKLEKAEKDRSETFGQLKVVTENLQLSADSLNDILSNNQKRGQYGEEVAEQLIQAVGFVKGENYLIHPQTDSGTRPDLTLLLPDKSRVNIDVKFPLNSLLQYQKSNPGTDQTAALKQFSTDVRQKIKEVTSRSYINPDEGTADFVILFVPNEMVFSFIYDKLREVWQEALKQKVILAGPFSFVAILRTIHWSHQTFKYQQNLKGIIQLVKIFEEEYQKFDQSLDKLGNQIDNVSEQYRRVAQVRHRKLSRIIDRIKGEEDDQKNISD